MGAPQAFGITEAPHENIQAQTLCVLYRLDDRGDTPHPTALLAIMNCVFIMSYAEAWADNTGHPISTVIDLYHAALEEIERDFVLGDMVDAAEVVALERARQFNHP